MQLGKTLYVTSRKQWRSWLAENHDREREIWLVYYRKSSGKPRIPYNYAVEEALCYGWIDSTQKGIDGEKFAQRFSPRRSKSQLSEMNRERIRRLIAKGRMNPAGLKAVLGMFDPRNEEKLVISSDILETLKADRQAWKNFNKLPEDYVRVRIGYIEARRKHGNEAFRKSLEYFIKMTAKNRKFGMLR